MKAPPAPPPRRGAARDEQEVGDMKQTFDVTGMTCAACSSRVEKTANAVPGVNAAVVNLLKNSMEVDYDGSPDTAAALCAAIDKAGYGASPRMPQGSAPAGGASGSMPGGGFRRAGRPGGRGGQRGEGGAHPAGGVLRVHHPALLYIHGAHVRLAAAGGLSDRPCERHGVRADAVPAVVARDLRELQVLPRGLQGARPPLSEHGLAHRVGIRRVHRVRRVRALPHRARRWGQAI